LLAAGSGRRFGGPKALADTGAGRWIWRALDVLVGCDEIVVVIGAGADDVLALLPPGTRTVRNPRHASGIGSSLAAGLTAIGEGTDVALVMLVDLPDVGVAVLDRIASHAKTFGAPRKVLARAAYQGRPGHPVAIGRAHFGGIIAGAQGDVGARDYLAVHRAELIECGDIGGGLDVDTLPQA